MTREQYIERNDKLRTAFSGGVVLMTPAVWGLDARIRGRALYRMSIYQKFDNESDHSQGMFIFAGWTFVWYVAEFAGELSITLAFAEE